MPSVSPSGIVSILKKVAPVICGPQIRISTTASRCREKVAVFYNFGGISHGNALEGVWLRLQLSNSGLMKATGCLVYVTRIAWNGIAIDSDPSCLEWTDEDGERLFAAKTMVRGDIGRRYINLCGCDQFNKSLHLASQRARRGYHSFDKSGLYTFDLAIAVDQITRSKKIRLNVLYDRDDWERVHFV